MKKESEEAKLFSEQLDRMLAGEEIKTGGEMNDDLRQALNFAGEIKAMRSEPSPQYHDLLKNKLLANIRAGEAETEQKLSWLDKFVRQPVWRTVTTVVVIAIISGIIWAAGFFKEPGSPQETSDRNQAVMTSAATALPQASAPPSLKAAGAMPAASESAAVQFLQVNGVTDKSIYTNSSSDPVDITITLENVSGQPLSIPQYPPILSLMQSDTMQPVFTFMAGDIATSLAPGETVTYSVTWDQRDAGGHLVSPGTYYLELEDLDMQGQSMKLNFASSVQFEIQ
jgi:hypothetical protein